MDPQAQAANDVRQLLESLAVYTVHNVHPPPSSVRLSEHVEAFVKDVLKDDVGDLLMKPTVQPPTVQADLPFADYFVSSSHNTYLLANQILGKASASSYTHVLSQGARCVEVDVWPSSEGPVVTHGHTLSQSIPFADVCAAIGASVYDDTWPVFVSLECHVYGEEQQQELVKIMREAWGARLVDRKLDGVEDTLVTPEMVMGRILVMVEYYPSLTALLSLNDDKVEVPSASSPSLSLSSSSKSEQDSSRASVLWPHRRSRVARHLRISQVLADVGYYLRSLKPPKNWYTRLFPAPPSIMLNISESSFLSLLSHSKTILKILITHAQSHIRRIYPKGLRLTSSNLDPYKFWGTGSHVVALNWQTYDRGMQVNEAMFVGTPGWLPKPQWMRRSAQESKEAENEQKLKIKGEAVGVCSVPPPSDRQQTPESKPYDGYVKAELFLPTLLAIPSSSLRLLNIQISSELEYRSQAQPVKPTAGDLDFAYPVDKPEGEMSLLAREWDNLWWRKKPIERELSSAIFGWQILEKWEELTFLRLSICKEFGKDDTLAVFCARVADIRRSLGTDGARLGSGNRTAGWRLVRLLDSHGKACGTVALVRFTLDLVD